jgi:hypothetical protein
MLEQIIDMAPEQWQELVSVLIAPIQWIPEMQWWFIDFFSESPSGWIAAAKLVFLFLPALLWIAAMWCTQLSIYTIPFRSGRLKFFALMLMGWWDATRSVWLYWVGIFRIGAVGVGWFFALARLAVKLIMEIGKQVLILPFTMTGKITKSYSQPGVPWVAFLMLIFWCLLEAVIFTFTLFPTVSEVLADLGGVDAPQYTVPILYMFLLMLILGSFACVQALVDAVKKREFKFIVQMVLVELFVMFFEVMFLYRELVDAITPWIAQQTGEKFRLGIVFTLSLAIFGWAGIRGMTWFLFGQFGTPSLLAFISRRPMVQPDGAEVAALSIPVQQSWRAPIEDFKREVEWLHAKSDELVEYLTLPILHLLASAMNFALILVSSRPIFSIPFKNLKEVMGTRETIAALNLQPKKVAP